MSNQLNLEKGDVLMKEGDKSDKIFYILSGHLDVLIKKDGARVKVAEVKEGEFVGEMAVIDHSPRSATVVAAEKSELLVITTVEFQEKMDELEPWVQCFIQTLIHRLKAQNQSLK